VVDTLKLNPQEVKKFSYSMAANIPAGVDLLSGAIYASRKASAVTPVLPTTLSNSPAADSPTIQLPVHPGVGAYMLLNPIGANEERVIVTAVSGSGPYTATVAPELVYAHAANEPITYEPGASALVLTSTIATVVEGTLQGEVQRGVSAREYRLFLLGTLSDGQVKRGELILQVTEDF
jgi:hypothetical protein